MGRTRLRDRKDSASDRLGELASSRRAGRCGERLMPADISAPMPPNGPPACLLAPPGRVMFGLPFPLHSEANGAW